MNCLKKVIKFAKKYYIFVFSLLAVFYSEIVLRVFTCKNFFDPAVIYIFLFSAVVSAAWGFFVSFFPEKAARAVYITLLAITFVNYAVQVVYHLFFGKYLIFFSIFNGGADQVIADGLVESTLSAVVKGFPAILLLSVPFVSFLVWGRKKIKLVKKSKNFCVLGLLGSALAAALVVGIIHLVPASHNIYTSAFDNNISVKSFGLVNTQIRDFKYNILGFPQNNNLEDEPADPEPEKEIEYNVMDIDFEKLIENGEDDSLITLDKYFAAQKPTAKNDMTGKYEGYNLIMITAEGFSPYAVDKTLTPTLYKMCQNGITFDNFYTPIWDVSTSDGEYVNCTGLIPKSGVWSMYLSGENYMPFCLGNQFKKLGVSTRYAFHNHNYAFYHRDISHPNMGYKYLGIGNGLENQIKKVWPESDLELMQATTKMYTSADRFCTYYMTVSGHLEYNRLGNSMAYKNWDAVKDMAASETVKAYYACQIEFDKALEKLLGDLEAAGKADNTLIAIAPDHYPYGLEDDKTDRKYRYFEELKGDTIETNFELYKSIFIVYSPSMTRGQRVKKYCSNLDILPTLSNMLGLEYDSRLIIGKDIFSDSESLVIMSDRSWITERGKYNANTEEFTPHSGYENKDNTEYTGNMNAVVRNKFKISAMMLENDYYAHVFEKE